jgi:hypothetical protein
MRNMKRLLLFLFLISLCIFQVPSQLLFAGSDAQFRIEILAYCGNDHKEVGEQCDGSDLGGQDCVIRGFGGGSLSCNASCSFDATACTSDHEIVAGGGGGSYSGGTVLSTSVSSIFIEGYAYPSSKVFILKDGQQASSTISDAYGRFKVTLTDITAGNYRFGVYALDQTGVKSSVFTFPAFITLGALTKVSGIFIAPTIVLDKNTVSLGESLTVSGQSMPESTVTISFYADVGFFRQIKTDATGRYSYTVNTSTFASKEYLVKAKATFGQESSSFSQAVTFSVGAKGVPVPPVSVKVLKGDVNNDGRVNLIDFSIAAYWYKKPLSKQFKAVEQERLNGDEKIDLKDFSIMAYYWTG